MKRIIGIAVATAVVLGCLCGCAERKVLIEALKTTREQTTQRAEPKKEEERVLAFRGAPNDKGYYSLDMPGSATDLMPLEQINDRLYWTAVVMADKKVDAFEAVPESVFWEAVNLEIGFNRGSGSPFEEDETGAYTTVGFEDFKRLSGDWFNLSFDIDKSRMPKKFALKEDKLHITYADPPADACGFVISEYKKEGNLWRVKGDIIKKDAQIFASGEFVLEETKKEGAFNCRILSFIKA